MELLAGERLDHVNDHLSLIQKTDGLTFGTDALLLAGYVGGHYEYGMEFGAGSGIVSLLLLTRKKAKSITAIEIQPSYAELTRRNATLNGLQDRLDTVDCDLRTYQPPDGAAPVDLIVTNPPYMKANAGKSNDNLNKSMARHEENGTVEEFCKHAGRLLKYGGTFVAVYRPDRLMDLLCSMRAAGIEPKRMTLVHADPRLSPSMVLVEGRRGGHGGLYVTPPLLLYADTRHTVYTENMEYILENGNFPPSFDYRKRRGVSQ